MNVALWVVASVLALAFVAGGALKLARPPQQLAASGMGYVEDFSPGTVKLIGGLEVMGGVGLVLPALTGIAPDLVPLAATGIVFLMIGAMITHVRRHELHSLLVNASILLLAGFVVWGRFGAHPFAG
jgi:hypothetical protein